MIKGLVVGLVLASTIVLGTSQTSHALHTVDTLTQSILGRAQQAEEQVQAAMDRKAQRQAEFDAKRQAIEQQIAERRAAVTEKLTGERAEKCEQQEVTINQTLDNRGTAAQRHFDKLKSLHEKLSAFVTEKELAVDNAAALELILGEKQDDAQATIDAVKALDFECTIADAHAPGMIVKDQFTEAKQALKDYRTAIKDYALAIRGAATAGEDNTSTESTQDDSTRPESDTASEQDQEVAQ